MYSDPHTPSPAMTGGTPARPMPRVAIVGSGISGLAAAHTLQGLAELRSEERRVGKEG